MIFIITLGGSEYARFDNEVEAVETFDAMRRDYPRFEIELKAYDLSEVKPQEMIPA